MNLQLPPMPPVVMQWITPESPFYTHGEFWLNVLTLLLVGATLLLVLETRRMRTSGDKSMREMLIHAEASAAAGNRSASATQDLVHVGERAWITVRDYKASWSSTTHLLQNMTITLGNSGHTPALDVQIWADFKIETAPYNNFPEIGDHKETWAGVIGPDNTFEVYRMMQWTTQRPGEQAHHDVPLQIQTDVLDKRRWLYLYGKVIYRDIFGQEHATVWCIADGREKGLIFTSRQNYAN